MGYPQRWVPPWSHAHQRCLAFHLAGPSNYISLIGSDFPSPQQLFQTCMQLKLAASSPPSSLSAGDRGTRSLSQGECPQCSAISNSYPSSLLPQELGSSLLATLSAQLLTLHLLCILNRSCTNDSSFSIWVSQVSYVLKQTSPSLHPWSLPVTTILVACMHDHAS